MQNIRRLQIGNKFNTFYKRVLSCRPVSSRVALIDHRVGQQEIKATSTLQLRRSLQRGHFAKIILVATQKYSNMPSDKEQWESVLYYWFDEIKDHKKLMGRWYGTSKAEIEEKYGDLVRKGRNGELKSWLSDPRGTLAHVVLFDQFCRTLYKGTGDAFSHDHLAREYVKKFLPGGPFSYKDLTPLERSMLYMPLMHAENIDDQNISVKLFHQLVTEATTAEQKKAYEGNLDFAYQHRDIVAKYGRFPKRNAAMGRTNTPEEEEFLKDNPYVF